VDPFSFLRVSRKTWFPSSRRGESIAALGSVTTVSSLSRKQAPTPLRAPLRILLLGGTGTIGRATARALVQRGHEVVCVVRARSAPVACDPDATEVRRADVTDPTSLRRQALRGERFDAVVSCLASRTGLPRDAWTVDHDAHADVLAAAREHGIGHFVLLSALCVQKPRLEFQRAKLAFERQLACSGLAYSIVRPTAFFKSLSGQFERVRRGRPFLVFGDGTLTACKPISDDDLAAYLAECLENPELQNRVLPIGGPGPAITPREQGEELFRLLGRPAKFTEVPVRLLDAIVAGLDLAGRVVPRLGAKAELARIGRYYATESMLVFDEQTGRYDADATPSTGTHTLFEHYAALARGEAAVPDRGDHAVF
jgi:divinyl chlorophyllide a 8-vinyl-reductase